MTVYIYRKHYLISYSNVNIIQMYAIIMILTSAVYSLCSLPLSLPPSPSHNLKPYLVKGQNNFHINITLVPPLAKIDLPLVDFLTLTPLPPPPPSSPPANQTNIFVDEGNPEWEDLCYSDCEPSQLNTQYCLLHTGSIRMGSASTLTHKM